MRLLYVIGGLVVFFGGASIVGHVVSNMEWKKLKAAENEYLEIAKNYGSVNAREHCPHRIVEFSQTGIVGVVTLTTKWCKICGKNLGPAKLKESIFGNRWT
jgi:hypothetical protein